MSVNSSSSSSNASFPHPPISPSIFDQLYRCFKSTAGNVSITTFTITSIFVLLPLCIFALYLGLQRWRQQRSNMTMSHSDVFTCHMIIIELMSVVGFILLSFGVYADLAKIIQISVYLYSLNLSAQTLFHILTCVERYLAVIHPITYLSLKKTKWIRIRNIAIGCFWPLCFVGTGLTSIENHAPVVIFFFGVTVFAFVVVSFCSLSVLCVLTRPGPGEGGGGRERVDQSKLRAFYTIMAILGVLMFRFGGNILATALYVSPQLGESQRCSLWLSAFWFDLPSSLVLPLLFVQRAGIPLCCKNNRQSGH